MKRFCLSTALLVALLYQLQHFLPSLAWGGVLAIATWPLVQKLERRGFSNGGAVATVGMGLLLGFGLPALAVIDALSPEVAAASRYVHQLNATGLPSPDWLQRLPLFGGQAAAWWGAHLSAPGALLEMVSQVSGTSVLNATGKLGGIGAGLAANAFYILLSLLTFVVFQLNASVIVKHLDAAGAKLLPAEYAVVRRLLPLSLRGTALGLGSVALLEGVVLGIAYAIAGAPMPVLLAVLTGYLALIPGGAPLSFITVSLVLLAKGSTAAALGLALWGTVELFLVDKFVRPRIIGASVELPFLAVLFGLLGGVSTMGIIGLFVGPFLMTVLFHYLRAAAKP
ncbi:MULTISPECIES: AI-2E family transporter [unclassified Variovorax]|uniref:AI-2E family transporter n=1 Tax=unclassified Variovorax TaxID=663243 RepID=UPI001318A6D1|nr:MULTISPECIES: AI-2E family transporter [unclassified Variovorax]VTU42844.1 putative inner membrane protein [Variovorax sp. PBL-H6]VTU43638.1 putative inner membrane protein [Variovorax sp. SRS16]VTU43701.1 putative inner membrane protein [Variovorax sp. PBL-E5]